MAYIGNSPENDGPYVGSGDEYIRTNSNQINQNLTIPLNMNGSSVGPITVSNTYTVTVNGVWTII
jgi:hypothetical protein